MELKLPRQRNVYRVLGRDSALQRIAIGTLDKSGVSADETDYLAPAYSLVWILRGRGTYIDAHGRTWPLGPGSAFQRNPDRRHSNRIDPASGWYEIFVDLDPDLWRALIGLRVIRDDPPVLELGLDRARIDRWFAALDALERADEHGLPELCVRCQGLVVEALASASATPAGDPVDTLCRLLAREADGRSEVRALCRRAGLDYEQTRRLFRQRLGVSPHQYRIRRRLERACALLHGTSRALTDIAAELGYHSPYEFSAQFRRWMGRPPSAYRSGRAG